MYRQKFKDTLSNKVRNSQTWQREIKEEDVLPKTPTNANIIHNMVETKQFFPPTDLDANAFRSTGHGEVKRWKRFPDGHGGTMLLPV